MRLPNIAISAALAGLLAATSAPARAGDGLLPNVRLGQLFNRPAVPPADVGDDEPPARGGPSNADLVVRIDRLERLNRELTGQIEQLQFQLRKLEEQARNQTPASAAAPHPQPLPQVSAAHPPAAATPLPPPGAPAATTPTTPVEPGRLRRSDAFDPAQNPGAPGAPRQLGTTLPSAPLQQAGVTGPLGGRDPGEAPNPMKPLDLGAPRPPAPAPAPAPGAGETQVATIQPAMGPKEEYELAAGLLKQGQYEPAQKGFEGFIAKHAKSRYVPDAVFGLGETYFQRGRHREAAEQYLKISTNYANSSRGPEAMLRLGQSLNALGAKEQACASFAEVGRKYPGASNTIRAAERESKKISC